MPKNRQSWPETARTTLQRLFAFPSKSRRTISRTRARTLAFRTSPSDFVALIASIVAPSRNAVAFFSCIQASYGYSYSMMTNACGPAALRAWRTGLRLTQAQAARMLGVSQAAWCDWEKAKKAPDIASGVRIESLTGIPVKAWVHPSTVPHSLHDATNGQTCSSDK